MNILKIIVKRMVPLMLIPDDAIIVIAFKEVSLKNPIIKEKRSAIGRTKPKTPPINKRKALMVLRENPYLKREKQSSIVRRKRKKNSQL